MSHNSLTGFDRPLQVELRTSRVQLTVLTALYGLAACAGLQAPLAWTIFIPLIVMMFAHAVHVYRLHISLSASNAVSAIAWNSQRGWRIRCRKGWLDAELRMPVFVTYRLAALRFSTGRFRTRRVIVTRDRLNEDDFRRLRVRLIQSAHGCRDRKKIPGAR